MPYGHLNLTNHELPTIGTHFVSKINGIPLDDIHILTSEISQKGARLPDVSLRKEMSSASVALFEIF